MNAPLMQAAQQRTLTGPATAKQPAGPVSRPLPNGPATMPNPAGPSTLSLPAGQSGVGLDAFAAKRAEAGGEFNRLQANADALVQRYGRDAYVAALAEAEQKARVAHAEYVQAARAAGVGTFTD